MRAILPLRRITFAALVLLLVPGSLGACEEPSTAGCWLPPFSETGAFDDAPPDTEEAAGSLPTAVSVSVLPDRRVLYFNGFEGDDQVDDTRVGGGIVPPGSNSRTRVLDLSDYLESGASPRATAVFSVPFPETGAAGDLFCSDLKQLPDGRVLAVGGTVNYDIDGSPWGEPPHRGEFEGIRDVRTFDPAGDTWTRNADMHHPRWYPSLISLPGDPTELFVVSGLYRLIYNESQSNIVQTETYGVASNRWTDNGPDGEQSLPLYPRLHLMPNGWILYASAGQTWNPLGQTADYETWRVMRWYQPESNTWATIAPAQLGTRNTPFSILMPLRPDSETGGYTSADVLIAGGTPTSYPPTLMGLNLVERVRWNADAPETVSREVLPSLNRGRWFPSGVLLPSGEVLAINGADRDQLVFPGQEVAIRVTEQYDPATQEWTDLAPSQRDRTYHNSAALLPDGSVLVGGHAPQPVDYGQNHENRYPGAAHNFRDPSFEVFQPPYLFRGPRPVIVAAEDRYLHGTTTMVETPDAGEESLQAVLSRLPAVTHLQDADQRTVELAITARDPETETIELRVPDDVNVLPSGFYYLFLLKDNGSGLTPSVAHIVQVGTASAPNPPPPPPPPPTNPTERSSGGGAMGPSAGVPLLLLMLALSAVIVAVGNRRD